MTFPLAKRGCERQYLPVLVVRTASPCKVKLGLMCMQPTLASCTYDVQRTAYLVPRFLGRHLALQRGHALADFSVGGLGLRLCPACAGCSTPVNTVNAVRARRWAWRRVCSPYSCPEPSEAGPLTYIYGTCRADVQLHIVPRTLVLPVAQRRGIQTTAPGCLPVCRTRLPNRPRHPP